MLHVPIFPRYLGWLIDQYCEDGGTGPTNQARHGMSSHWVPHCTGKSGHRWLAAGLPFERHGLCHSKAPSHYTHWVHPLRRHHVTANHGPCSEFWAAMLRHQTAMAPTKCTTKKAMFSSPCLDAISRVFFVMVFICPVCIGKQQGWQRNW